MHLGELEVQYLHGGNFYLDGGAMFGVVPKPLWEKKSPPDSRNRIRLAANSLLVRTQNKSILIETGNGTKWPPKLRDIYGIQEGDPLIDNLAAKGIPTFPNAKYIVQAAEIAHAANPTERDRASYFEENFLPMQHSGQWHALAGDTEILPGISTIGIPGHNANIQAFKLTGGGKTIFFVADLFPTRHHLSLPWIMAYDL